MTVGINSRFRYTSITRIVQDDSGDLLVPEFCAFRPSLASVQHPDNRTLNASVGLRWSRFSWELLGAGERWWILADYSDVVNPFKDGYDRNNYVAIGQLINGLPMAPVTSVSCTKANKFNPGDRVRIENLVTGAFLESVVVASNYDRAEIVIAEATPSAAVAAGSSRVSRIELVSPTLVAPSGERALFECLDFSNPTNVLPED